MCGRFVLIGDWGKIAQEFDLSETESTLSATGDIYPGQESACIIRTETGNNVVNLHWGFVPKWATPKSKPKLLINARAETLGEKPAFGDAFQTRRCLIVPFGFYEWTVREKPFYFYLRSGRPFGLAGIYEPAINAASGWITANAIKTGYNHCWFLTRRQKWKCARQSLSPGAFSLPFFKSGSTDGYATPLAGADANTFGQIQDEYFAVAHITSVSTLGDGNDCRLHKIFIYGDVQPDFFQQAARLFRTAINFRESFLSALAQNFGYGH
jgi:hypothetical protein